MNKRKTIASWNLYVITDENLSKGRSHLEIAKSVIAGGAEVIQLRDKTASSKKLYHIGLDLRKLTRENQVSFIVNDRLDIALAVDADGLHIGQSDLPVHIARQLMGHDKILGVSASSLQEALAAEKHGADYLGVGPIFEARGTKADAGVPLHLSLISEIQKNSKLPQVAIGGINSQNVPEVIKAGALAVAVISAIVAQEDIQMATRQLRKIIQMAKEQLE